MECVDIRNSTDLEVRFFIILSAALVVQMATMDEPSERLPAPLHVFNIAVQRLETPIWKYGALFCPCSIEPVLQKRVDEQAVAVACVRMLVRRKQVDVAARLLTKDAKELVLAEKDKRRVFQVAR